MSEYLLIGILLLAVHLAIVAIVAAIARAQGRSVAFWAAAAMILGPIALVLLFIWRERSVRPDSPTPSGPVGHSGR